MKSHWILAAACVAGAALSAPANAEQLERQMTESTPEQGLTSADALPPLSDDSASRKSGGATSVPEPGALGLFGLGLLAVGYARYRRRASA